LNAPALCEAAEQSQAGSRPLAAEKAKAAQADATVRQAQITATRDVEYS
jgi:hypothetical protein